MPADQPRYLHRRVGYTRLHTQGLFAEPEAVSKTAQDDITARAHRKQRAIWAVAKDKIELELQQAAEDIPSPHVRRGVRSLRRQLAAIERKLAQNA